MKNFIFLTVLFLTLFAASSQTTFAQREKRLNSAPPAFRTFFAKFIKAVEKSDKTAVAAMTVFPFQYGFDAGDEGTMTKTQFVRGFNRIFGDSPRRFMTEKNPVFSRGDGGSYMISTEDAAHLSFVKSGGVFKFSAYIVEP
jgi:hypothetical protein